MKMFQPAIACLVLATIGTASAGQKSSVRNRFRSATACETVVARHPDGTTETNEICAVNTSEGAYWFVSGGSSVTTKPVKDGEAAASSLVGELKASPNGKYLAVVHFGEGHSWLNVMDLHAAIADGKLVERREVMPYPGNIQRLVSWHGGTLRFESDMLLSYRGQRDESGRVPSELMLPRSERFDLNPDTGEIVAVNPALRDPGAYFGAKLIDPHLTATEKKDSILPALARLKSPSSLPFLKKALTLGTLIPIRDGIQRTLEAVTTTTK